MPTKPSIASTTVTMPAGPSRKLSSSRKRRAETATGPRKRSKDNVCSTRRGGGDECRLKNIRSLSFEIIGDAKRYKGAIYITTSHAARVEKERPWFEYPKHRNEDLQPQHINGSKVRSSPANHRYSSNTFTAISGRDCAFSSTYTWEVGRELDAFTDHTPGR